MGVRALILGVDGGATKCRARLCAPDGVILGEGRSGPANISLDLGAGFRAADDAARQCLRQAGLPRATIKEIIACLAFAGATEPRTLAAARNHPHPFAHAIVTNDGHASCVGAHGGQDGGVVAVGTGLVGWAILDGRHFRVGGWGFPVSDEGSGAWLGCESLRRTLWAHDERTVWTPLLRAIFQKFDADPHEVVRWTGTAGPKDYATLAPEVVRHAEGGDTAGTELMSMAGRHVDQVARRLVDLGVPRLALVGGLAPAMVAWLSEATRRRLAPPEGDALDGAVRLARAEAEAIAGAHE